MARLVLLTTVRKHTLIGYNRILAITQWTMLLEPVLNPPKTPLGGFPGEKPP